jgi:hypothetical protein
MGIKISAESENTNPSRNDFALGETASGPTTNRFKYDNVLKLAKATDLSNPYKFSAYQAPSLANYLATGSTEYTIPYDTELFDTGSNYDTSTHQFTAPVAGFYHFTAVALIPAYANSAIALRIYQNSTQQLYDQRICGTSGTIIHCSVTGLLQLSANDTVHVTGVSSSSNTGVDGGQGITYFQGHLVSLT